jgi:site-specific DNA-adenine methylase
MNQRFPGQKDKDIVSEFIEPNLPEYSVYVEPFGGTFTGKHLSNKPDKLIYNDINDYDLSFESDVEVYHTDYREIIEKFDGKNVLFYCDVPYYGKEQLYGLPSFDKSFHVDFMNNMLNIDGKFAISYEDVPFIRELWADKNVRIIKYAGTQFRFRHEILIVNY